LLIVDSFALAPDVGWGKLPAQQRTPCPPD
jgi:hypothetical protein